MFGVSSVRTIPSPPEPYSSPGSMVEVSADDSYEHVRFIFSSTPIPVSRMGEDRRGHRGTVTALPLCPPFLPVKGYDTFGTVAEVPWCLYVNIHRSSHGSPRTMKLDWHSLPISSIQKPPPNWAKPGLAYRCCGLVSQSHSRLSMLGC